MTITANQIPCALKKNSITNCLPLK